VIVKSPRAEERSVVKRKKMTMRMMGRTAAVAGVVVAYPARIVRRRQAK